MFDILFNVVAFIVALGVLVTFHEYGHFWVARKMGVKVLRFSVGFGKPLWRKVGRVDNTEFVVAAIPLGGYVKMLDEREGKVAPEEVGRAFNRQNVWARIAIVAAGPIANLLLAIVVYWATFMIGVNGLVPLVGEAPEGTAAAKAGFQREDLILSIEGQEVETMNAVRLTLLDQMVDKGREVLSFQVREADGATVTRELDTRGLAILKQEGDVVRNLGITAWWPEVDPIIGEVHDGGAAKEAGLQSGDRIITADGEAIQTWRDWVLMVRKSPNKVLDLQVEREHQMLSLQLIPRAKKHGDLEYGFIGASENQSRALLEKSRTVVRYGPIDAFSEALVRTWRMTLLTFKMMGKLVMGEASMSNISGPITIAQIAGQTASVGLDQYLSFLALISVSLGVLNLLPIPMLDGGHLLYYSIEVLTRRPVSERIQLFGQQLGILLLAGLMSLAFYNDILRLLQ